MTSKTERARLKVEVKKRLSFLRYESAQAAKKHWTLADVLRYDAELLERLAAELDAAEKEREGWKRKCEVAEATLPITDDDVGRAREYALRQGWIEASYPGDTVTAILDRAVAAEKERDEWRATCETLEDGTGATLLADERDEWRDRAVALEKRNGELERVRAAAQTVRDGFPFLDGEPNKDFGGAWIEFVVALAASGAGEETSGGMTEREGAGLLTRGSEESDAGSIPAPSALNLPWRAEHSLHGPSTIYDTVEVGWIVRVKESLPNKREIAEFIVAACNAVGAGEETT